LGGYFFSETPCTLCIAIVFQNMRVMSKYYTRIRMSRMAELLDLTEDVSMGRVYSVISVNLLMSMWSCFVKKFYTKYDFALNSSSSHIQAHNGVELSTTIAPDFIVQFFLFYIHLLPQWFPTTWHQRGPLKNLGAGVRPRKLQLFEF